MHQQHFSAGERAPRITRAEQLTGQGDYWATCRRDDADQSMFGPLQMLYAVPAGMLVPATGERAWSYWYGQLKTARKATERAARRLTPLEASYSPSLISVPNFERLTRRLDVDLFAVAADHDGSFRLHGQDQMPLVHLMTVLEKAIGAEVCLQIYEMAMTASARDLCTAVEAEFPFMARLHQNSVLIRSTSQHLLGLGRLIRTLNEATACSAPDLLALQLLATCLIRTLPARIGILATITNPVLAHCFNWPCRFYGLTNADLPAGADIWALVPGEVLSDTVLSLKAYEFPMYNDPDFNDLVLSLDTLTLAAHAGKPVAMELNALYQDCLGGFALAQQADLQQFMKVGGVFFAAEPYKVPEDLVRPGVSLAIEGQEAKVAEALFNLMVACYCAGNILPLVEQIHMANLQVEAVGEKIKALSLKPSPKNVAKIQALGKRANEDLDQGRVWFVDEAMRLKPLIASWAAFYDELATLR